jgi:hypothetical protein
MKALAVAVILASLSSGAFASTIPDIGKITPLSTQKTTFDTTNSHAFGPADIEASDKKAPTKLSQIMIKVQWTGQYSHQTNYLFAKKGESIDQTVNKTTHDLDSKPAPKPLCAAHDKLQKDVEDSINASFLPVQIDEDGATLAITSRETSTQSGNITKVTDTCLMIDKSIVSNTVTRKDHFSFGKPMFINLGKDIVVSVTVVQVPGA